jgi:hypothetical protein
MIPRHLLIDTLALVGIFATPIVILYIGTL